MSVTNEDVLHVAQLARLAIDDTRLPGLVAELNGILQHIDALQQATIPADLTARAVAGMPLVPRLATHGDAGASASASDGEGDA